MRASLAILLGLLLVAGARAQDAGAEACDASTSGAALVDLGPELGKLACRVPASVNITDVLGKLTGTLNYLTVDQLAQLPGLMEVMLSAEPSAIAPFLALSADELDKLVPLLTGTPAETLAATFPLLAKQSDATVARMLKFLSGVPRAQLERLSPLFGAITEGQVNVIVKALNTLPGAAWDALIKMMQALGPVSDVAVSVKQSKGLLKGAATAAGNSSSSSSGSEAEAVAVSASASVSAGVSAGGDANATAPAAKAVKVISLPLGAGKISFSHGGSRHLLQDVEPAAAPAPAAACDPDSLGIELGIQLIEPFGVITCKFGADTLRPHLVKVMELLNAQSAQTLANLPALTDALAKADPKAFASFFGIPPATLKALIPAVAGLDAAVVEKQLKLLGAQDAAALDNMAYFLRVTPASQMPVLIGMFARVTDKQAATLTRFMNALSAGQITLAIHLLDSFGFAVDAIGRAMPAKEARDTGYFKIGPFVHVHLDKGTEAAVSAHVG